MPAAPKKRLILNEYMNLELFKSGTRFFRVEQEIAKNSANVKNNNRKLANVKK